MNLHESGKQMALRAHRMYPIGEDGEQHDVTRINRDIALVAIGALAGMCAYAAAVVLS